jgi:hypothetical protein
MLLKLINLTYIPLRKKTMDDHDHLYSLIHQLNKGEQSYFKKIKSAFGVSDSYILSLFSIFQKQEKYNEAEIIKKVKAQLNAEFYAPKKHLLHLDILDVLIYARLKKQDSLWQINRMVLHAMILKEKMLFDDACKQLAKAKKISEDNEFFYKTNEINQHLIEIINQAKSMINFSFSENVESIRMENIQNNIKSTNAEQFFILADKLYRKGEELRLTGNEKIRFEIKNIFDDPLLENSTKTLSLTALSCFHFIMYSKCINYNINQLEALYHLKELIVLQQKIKRFTPRSKASQMGNYIVLALQASKNDEALEMLNWLENLSEEQSDEYILFSFLAHKGIYLSSTNQNDKLELYVAEIEAIHTSKLEDARFSKETMDIQHLLFCYYFRKNEYKKAYNTSITIDKYLDTHTFNTLKFNEKILRLICAYELQEFELMQKEIRGIKYLLKTANETLDADMLVFNTLNQLTKAKNEDAKKVILENFNLNYHKFLPNDKYSFVIQGFGFPHWVASKLKNENLKKAPIITWNK